MAITLDLRKLTDAKVKRALTNVGNCRYSAPCILGTLIPASKRLKFDGQTNGAIDVLAKRGLVRFPGQSQLHLATALQRAFDAGDEEKVLRLVSKARETLAKDPQP